MNSLANRIVDNLLSRKPTQECGPMGKGKFPFKKGGSASREAEGSASRESEGGNGGRGPVSGKKPTEGAAPAKSFK